MGGDIVENHRAGADELAGLQQGRILDRLDGEVLRLEDFRDRIILEAGGQQDTWTACDFDPAVRAVVARMGVLFRQDLRLILEGAGARNAVGELGLPDAVEQRDGAFGELLAVAPQHQRDRDVLRATHDHGKQEGLTRLDAFGEFQTGDTEVVLGLLADQAEVHRDAAVLELRCSFC